MAAKRKVEENNEDFVGLQTKRHENTTQQQLTTSDVTDYYQWYEQRGPWICLFDWTSGHYYYQNLNSFQTQWEKPVEWDSIHPIYLPVGQYSYHDETTDNLLNKDKRYKQSWNNINAKIKTFLERPARRQIDPEEKEKAHWMPEGATEYNIWYDRWVGEHWREGRDHGPSETRCCLETDAGFTKANIYDPGGNKHYFCIYFAKGCCHLGPECGYLHVLPSDKDKKRIDLVHDVFGRERHRLHKEDMGGVGAFNKECRTLYVGGLGRHDDLEKLLWTEFGEWGEIEDIRIIPKRHIAFVRYKNRVNAEFAKIAMSGQKLNNRELLNVRWAFDDPNPKAQKQELLNSKHRLLEAASDRAFLQGALLRHSQETGHQVTGPYPNTDNQYPVECGPMTKGQIEEAEVLANVYTDCTRLDDALKRMESSQLEYSKESETQLQVATNNDNQRAQYSENLTDNTTVLKANWGAYLYSAGSVPCRNAEPYCSYSFEPTWDSWEESHECSSTKDPYRKLITSYSINNAEVSTNSNEQGEGPN